MSFIDTYLLATGGQNFRDTFSLAVNGVLVRVIIEDIPSTQFLGGGIPSSPEKEKEKKKKVTVIATIEGIEYTKTVIVNNRPNLSIKDIKIEIREVKKKPNIRVKIIN